MSAYITVKWIPAADMKKGRGGKSIKSIILHSTCGRKLGDIATLTEEGGPVVSCHFYVTRSGLVYQFVRESDTAFHAGKVFNPDHGNTSSIGIEQEHFDPDDRHPNGENWPEVQVKRVAQIVCYLRQKYGDLPALSHAAVAAPKGRKQDPYNYRWDLLKKFVKEEMAHTWELRLV